MTYKRKFSIFISSTYEDLKEERQALFGVALENGFIPVGMEQFHGAPADQWSVITKFIDECDFYLLVVGGRYGSIDESVDKSYTEKEYDYAKSKGIPVLVLIKNPSSITEDKKDDGENKYDLMKRLEEFRLKVKNDRNTVDSFSDLNGLKYAASATLKNALEYVSDASGWVRYKDIGETVKDGLIEHQQDSIEEKKGCTPFVGVEDVGFVDVDPAFLLVYAASGNGTIIRQRTWAAVAQITVSGKDFVVDGTLRESARWEEALDKLIEWKWVKPIKNDGSVFLLTGTGYRKADWLKENMNINTDNDPLDELKLFE